MKTSAVAGAVAFVILCVALGGLAVRATQAQDRETATVDGPLLTISPAGDGGIQVCWDPVEGARCRVLRAFEAAGPYQPVSDWLTEPGFVDVNAPADGAFYRLEVQEESGLGLLPTDGDPPAPSAEELAATIASLHDEGRYREAADLAADYLDGHPVRDLDRQWIQYWYARELLCLQDYVAARVQIEGLIADYRDLRLDESLPEVFVDDAKYLLGWLELHQGDPLLALSGLSDLADASPGSNRAVDALFLVNRVLADHVDNGVKKRRDPAYWDAERIDKTADILANLQRAGQLDSDHDRLPEMWQDYLVFLVCRPRCENLQQVRQVIEEIRTRYPGTPQAEYAMEELIDLKTLWGDAAERVEAEALLDERIDAAIAAGDADRRAHWSYYKGKLLLRLGRYAELRSFVDEVTTAVPDFLPYEFRAQIVSACRAQGDPAAARLVLDEMERDHTDDRPDKQSLAAYLRALTYADEGNLEQAAQIMAEVAAEYPESNTGAIAERTRQRYVKRLTRPRMH